MQGVACLQYGLSLSPVHQSNSAAQVRLLEVLNIVQPNMHMCETQAHMPMLTHAHTYAGASPPLQGEELHIDLHMLQHHARPEGSRILTVQVHKHACVCRHMHVPGW